MPIDAVMHSNTDFGMKRTDTQINNNVTLCEFASIDFVPMLNLDFSISESSIRQQRMFFELKLYIHFQSPERSEYTLGFGQ